MSKYCWGKLSGTNLLYVRLKEWYAINDKNGDLLQSCKVLKTFKKYEDVFAYINYLKKYDEEELR